VKDEWTAPVTASRRFHPVSSGQLLSHVSSWPAAPKIMNGRDSPLSGSGLNILPSRLTPARTRGSVTMVSPTLAPPSDMPTIATRCGSCAVSSSSTNETSRARLSTASLPKSSTSSWHAAQVVTRPSGNVVAKFS
jgi:hypothetical protein